MPLVKQIDFRSVTGRIGPASQADPASAIGEERWRPARLNGDCARAMPAPPRDDLLVNVEARGGLSCSPSTSRTARTAVVQRSRGRRRTHDLRPAPQDARRALAESVHHRARQHTVLNVALPTPQSQLHPSSSSLEWIVDAYLLACAGLLLMSGPSATVSVVSPRCRPESPSSVRQPGRRLRLTTHNWSRSRPDGRRRRADHAGHAGRMIGRRVRDAGRSRRAIGPPRGA